MSSVKINECPADEALAAEFIVHAKHDVEKDMGLLPKRLSQYLGMMRAMHLWFHGAHNVVRGTSFSGDHVDLFGKIYLQIQAEIDSAIEKAVGVTGDEGMACPMHITKTALQVLSNYPSPPSISSLAMAAVGLEMEKHFLEMLEVMFRELDEAGLLTLGLNDYLAALANSHENNVYLLHQRVKTELEN